MFSLVDFDFIVLEFSFGRDSMKVMGRDCVIVGLPSFTGFFFEMVDVSPGRPMDRLLFCFLFCFFRILRSSGDRKDRSEIWRVSI